MQLEEPPPVLAVVGGEPSPAHSPAGTGALNGRAVAAGLWKLCTDVTTANVLAGALVCTVMVPVAIAAVPAGAVVGLGADAMNAAGGTLPPGPAETTPAPAWWIETREALLTGVAAQATDVGFVVFRPIAVSADMPTLQVSIAAVGIESSGGTLFQPFITVRGRLLVGGDTVAEEMLTLTGPASEARDAWTARDYGRLRDALAALSADASGELAGKLLLSHCDTVVAAQPDGDASVCGDAAQGPP